MAVGGIQNRAGYGRRLDFFRAASEGNDGGHERDNKHPGSHWEVRERESMGKKYVCNGFERRKLAFLVLADGRLLDHSSRLNFLRRKKVIMARPSRASA